MNLLLDTMAFIWWASEPEQLPEPVRAACTNTNNTLVVSVASIWEIQAKMEVARVKMRSTLLLSDALPSNKSSLIRRQMVFNLALSNSGTFAG